MTIQQMWEREYKEQRYLDHLSQEQLHRRAEDLMGNIVTLTTDSKIGCIPVIGDERALWRRWVHLLVEMHLRYGAYPAGFQKDWQSHMLYPNPRSSISQKAVSLVKQIQSLDKGCLFKYGKQEHLQRSIKEGIIRLSPASKYEDSTLSSATRDTELEIDIQPGLEQYQMNVFDGKTLKKKDTISLKDAKFKQSISTDYYMYCVSEVLKARLFDEFEADSCLVIKQPDEFANRLWLSVQANLPDYKFGMGQISYFDPILPVPTTPEIFNTKHFRYTYQSEFRYVCVPNTNIKELEPTDLNVGSLEDICEMHVLD